MADAPVAEAPMAVERARVAATMLDPAAVPGLRRRMTAVLFLTAALGSTGYIAAITVGTLVAASIHGDATLGGAPTAAATIGTATAAAVLSSFMLRAGRRPGLLLGLLVGIVGAMISVGAVIAGSIALLFAASALTGVANAVGNLGRYVAADLVPAERRASAIGVVVWGSTIGAVSGPNLVAPAGDLARAAGLPALAGAYLLTVGFLVLAGVIAFVFLRPEPYVLAHPSAVVGEAGVASAPRARVLLRRPSVAVALVTLVAGQVVMVLVMTMTPIHLTDHGHGLATVGFVLSAHTFGMFALSPISGRLTDRFGSPTIIAAGLATLAVAGALAAIAPPDGGPLLTVALFLLGYGWNLGFVAGSTMLTAGLGLAERTRIQGVADGLIWSTAAIASLGSGLVVAAASYATLGLLAASLLVIPAAFLLRLRLRTA